VLAILGGLSGLLLAYWGLHLLRSAIAGQLPIQRLESVSIDGWVLGFTIAASLLSGLFFGLVPAFSASGTSLTDALKEGGRSGSAAAGKRTRSAFVVAEVALALVLLVGAGLLVRSFVQVTNVDPGFDAARTVSMSVSLPAGRYRDGAARDLFFTRLFDRIDALPGVDAAGATSFLPISGLGAATGFEIVGAPTPPRGEEPVCDVRVVANDYFKSMGIPLVKGRLFREGDPSDLKGRLIINETFARQHWPGEDPIGKRVRVSWGEDVEDEVIGVVGDVHLADLETDPRATIYWPYPRVAYTGMTITVRAKGDPLALVNAVVRIIREQDPQLAVASIKTMGEVLATSTAERRITMLLIAVFAAAALLLAAVGIYGVIAYSVTERTQEIGIRMALGAARRNVLRMVVGQAMALAAIGIAAGGLLALVLTRALEGMLFEIEASDPVTFVVVAAVLAAVAALASYIPGRRATHVDPIIALRGE
jgi:putative ABC transport system permease protein